MTTKKDDEKTAAQQKVKEFVVLKRIHYRAFANNGSKYIDPAPDPYSADAPRLTFEHLSDADVRKLVLKKIIAPAN